MNIHSKSIHPDTKCILLFPYVSFTKFHFTISLINILIDLKPIVPCGCISILIKNPKLIFFIRRSWYDNNKQFASKSCENKLPSVLNLSIKSSFRRTKYTILTKTMINEWNVHGTRFARVVSFFFTAFVTNYEDQEKRKELKIRHFIKQ